MRTSLRFATTLFAFAVLSLLGSCGSSDSAVVAASPSLAGNWDFAATAQPASASQIGHLGGAVFVSATGAITSIVHALPMNDANASSLCYPTMSNIAVTGTLTSDNTLTSSSFDGNMLTVRGTYVAGSGVHLPFLANATYSITGPCAVSTQAIAASQEPVASGTYTGTATMSDISGLGSPVPFTVPFMAVFSNVTSPVGVPNPNGYYTVSVVVTFPQDICASSPASFTATGFSVGVNLSISYTDPVTFTRFGAAGHLAGDLSGSEFTFSPITVTNGLTCQFSGSAIMDRQAAS